MFISTKHFPRGPLTVAAALALYLATPGAGAQTASISTPGNSFSPAELEITAGTEVTWTINGFHNVVQTTGANCEDAPQGFTSGAAGAVTSYSLTFDEPGTYYYKCDPHCAQGMRGVITVVAEPGDGDGDGPGDGDGDEGSGGTDGAGGVAGTTGGADGAGGSVGATGGADGVGGTPPSAGGSVGATGGTPGATGGTDSGDPTDPGDGDDEAGCSCRIPGGPVPPLAFGPFALLGLALLRRRGARS